MGNKGTKQELPEYKPEIETPDTKTVEELWNDVEGGPPVRQVTAVVIGLGNVRTLSTMRCNLIII